MRGTFIRKEFHSTIIEFKLKNILQQLNIPDVSKFEMLRLLKRN